MRFLILDANYRDFLDGIYRMHSGLSRASYDEQRQSIRAGLFGEANFQADALQGLGHEADVIVTNAHDAQRAWAIEHGFGHLAPSRWGVRLRRGFIPWLSRPIRATAWPIVLAQAQEYRPDVVYVAIMDTIPTAVAAQLRRFTRLVVAQIATTLPNAEYREYDLVLSSIPAIVDRFRRAGIDSEYVPLAFEPSVRDRVPVTDRDIPVSFVGSFSNAYEDREQIVEAIAMSAPLQTWTPDRKNLASRSPIRATIRGSAFGRRMYEILGRSLITLNTHGTVSGPYANNLRLFEATGMGALLVTDDRENLPELFTVGSEIAAFRDPTEAAELVRHFLDHPAEAARIALAGHSRTLRDHTWTNRMERLLESVATRT